MRIGDRGCRRILPWQMARPERRFGLPGERRVGGRAGLLYGRLAIGELGGGACAPFGATGAVSLTDQGPVLSFSGTADWLLSATTGSSGIIRTDVISARCWQAHRVRH
jgi:hypothetical protein